MDYYTREQIENWASDFVMSDAARHFPLPLRDLAAPLLIEFLTAACERRDMPPAELEEADVRAALLERVSKLQIPADMRARVPDLCGAFLAMLAGEGRIADGRALGAFVRALTPAFEESASGKKRPAVNPGSRIGRNDPCPCGSGRKYKQCHGKKGA